MILTVTFNSTTDLVIPLKKLSRGHVLRTPFIYSYPGGKGTNAARAAAALGMKTAATGFCSGAEIKNMHSFLKHHKITPDFVPVSGTNRPCALITEYSPARETIINSSSGLLIFPESVKKMLAKLRLLSKKHPYIIFSGSLPPGLPAGFYKNSLKAISKKTVSLLDSSGEPLLKGIQGNPSILKINIRELKSAFRVNLSSRPALKKFIIKLASRYKIKTVIITLNELGAVLYSGTDFFRFSTVKVKKVVSPVGSGDCFSAGYIYGLSKGFSSAESCRYAMAAAAANLSHTGSAFIEKKEVLRLVKKVKYTKF